jgi:putative resolvase
MKYVSIKEASFLIGVTTTTLRRWEKDGKFRSHHRTVGNHRRYSLDDIIGIIHPDVETRRRKTVCYARVSSQDQKQDLVRQTEVLNKYTLDNNLSDVEHITDIGSGINFKKRGLNELIRQIINNEIDTIVLTHKDRLLRFGSDLIINLAKHFNTKTIILNQVDRTFEEELAGDVIEILTVFSAKLYGKRSHKNKKSIKNTEIAKETEIV